MLALEHSKAGRQWRSIPDESIGADRFPNQLSLGLSRPSRYASERRDSLVVKVDGGFYHI